MTTIESNIIQISLPANKVYEFLSDLNNHKSIMPSQVNGWSSDSETCTYTIQGTGTVHLKIEEKTPNSLVRLVPNGKIPFPFSVNWIIKDLGDKTEVQSVMDADLNAILRMMAVKPLTNFINLQVSQLHKVLNAAQV